jgi:dipeptidyl aminopeptidase/acylaminoacyl peptidase
MNWMLRCCRAALVAAGVVSGCAGAAWARPWVSADGRQLEADFVRATATEVTLRRAADRREFTVALESLSEGDREWVRAKLAEPEKPEPVAGEGVFAGKVTGEWEKLEFGSLKFRFFGGTSLDARKRYPLVVFLHGRGSGGDDNERQLGGQARKFASDEIYKANPSFVVVPQCPDDSVGWNGEFLDDVIGLVEAAAKSLPVDEDRLYITGVSMGGFGTFAALAKEPKLFAAAVPVCGGGNPSAARSLRKVAIWVHHGAADDVVGVENSRRMVEALEDERGIVRYTEYDEASGIKHNAWDPCYNNPEVFTWLFAQRRGGPAADAGAGADGAAGGR